MRGSLLATCALGDALGDAASHLPAQVPVARIEPISTVGEMHALTGAPYLPHVCYSASEEGAHLLVWQVDEFLLTHLSRLLTLLPSSWIAKSPLSLITTEPSLATHLRLSSLEGLSAEEDASRLLVVLSGELIDDVATVSVRLAADRSSSPPQPQEMSNTPPAVSSRTFKPTRETSGMRDSSKAEGQAQLEVTVHLHSVSCPDVSSALVECGLKVIGASIHSDDVSGDGLLDTTIHVFRVRADDAEKLDLKAISQRLRERLADLLAPGNWPLLTSRWSSSTKSSAVRVVSHK